MTDEILHAFARVALRLCTPQSAYAIVRRVGRFLPTHGDRSDLVRAGKRLRRRGTCLSRALTIAARAPEAELVIGVAPRAGESLFAHAWLELGGQPIDPADVAGYEIARLGDVASSRGTVSSFR